MVQQAALNEGWRYIKLPQTIYLISPEANNYYFGYADPRFKILQDSGSTLSFQEICTYSFLGCGEFRKDSGDVWTNGSFQVPLSILNVLVEVPAERRSEIFLLWKNISNRSPQLVKNISILKDLRIFTDDGMYLYSANVSKELREEINSSQGLVIFNATGIDRFEDYLERYGLPKTRALRTALLPVLLTDGVLHPFMFQWVSFLSKILSIDEAIRFLQGPVQEHWEGVRNTSFNFLVNVQYEEDRDIHLKGIEFMKGFGSKFLRKTLQENPSILAFIYNKFCGNHKSLSKVFSFNKKEKTDKPNFFKFVKKYKIPLTAIPYVLKAEGEFLKLSEEFNFDFPKEIKLAAGCVLRTPQSRIELLSWGHELHNCIRHMNDKPFTTDFFISGIFKGSSLIGACYVEDRLKISSLLGAFNKALPIPSEDIQQLMESMVLELKKIHPAWQYALDHAEELQEPLVKYVNDPGSLEDKRHLLEDLHGYCVDFAVKAKLHTEKEMSQYNKNLYMNVFREALGIQPLKGR